MLDLDFTPSTFSLSMIDRGELSLWRYRAALPFDPDFSLWRSVTMGEGLTAAVPLDAGDSDLWVKPDYMMPTLSFKDRGAAVLIAHALSLGVRRGVQDSSGNAGNAVAAYAGRAGMSCDIYVPEHTSPKKVRMIEAHGAVAHLIPGSREDTAAAALEAAQKGGAFYASHVYNPYFYQGTKTYAYELYEQFGRDIPETAVVPVGNGTLLLGCYYGFDELYRLGAIDKLPRLIAIQAAGCAPIHKAFHAGESQVAPVANTGTEAEGIAIALPLRGAQILRAARETGGDILIAPEEGIAPAKAMLARRGLYVEPTTAATLAGFLPYYRQNRARLGRCVVPLCGAGLKAEK
jgi:threonine synthase